MSTKKERAEIGKFVRHQLRDKPDLSKLTLGLLKRQYLVHVGRESLSPEAKAVMKQVVQEELAKMQGNDDDESDSEEVDEPQNKRKRENQDEESEEEIESRGKKRRFTPSTLSSDETGSEDDRQSRSSSEGRTEEVKTISPKRNPENKEELVSDNSTDEEMNESKSKSNETGACSSPEQKPDSQKITANGKKEQIKNASDGRKTSESDAESSSGKSDASNGKVSPENEDKALVNKRDDGSDSDSSSLPSLEEDKDHGKKAKDEKKKTAKGVETSRSQKQDGDKAIVKLKRYISLCGVRRNYKKLLEGCKSIRAKVAVLKKELEDLGVQGQPSLEKCKKIRMKREEAQELAELDVGNIIATQGRPKRRGISARQEYNESPSPAYQRTLNSSSGSDQENNSPRERKKVSDWANLRGIISDDGDSS
ncbi:HIRA-interacting protein 3 isoform X1 [Oryzias latipes]|uniref:HIRA interacting protein 3 n=1 Tax=Oryzias latipes TaxID=8090 RepID=H2M6E3_ORYLA|nr:HIRA-interacting protein 3 isoform X1 [Oryzias latipes]